jgi:CarD family transcriptional regulator
LDTIDDIGPTHDPLPEPDEPTLEAEGEEPAALDESEIIPDMPLGVAEDGVEALAEADIEDVVNEEEIDAELATVTESEEEEEDEEDLPPVPNRVAPRMPGHMPGVPNRPIVHPRLPAKAEIFHEGDYVVYPTHGVGKVERIATEEIAGFSLELIHITFDENRMTLRVPVSKARTAGLRKLATRKMFDEAMAVLKGRARIKRTMWSRRAQEYEAKINSGDPIAIAEVVRDLHRNAGQPDQSFSERQIYEQAMDRLAAELAALDQTDKPTAVQKLGDFLKS